MASMIPLAKDRTERIEMEEKNIAADTEVILNPSKTQELLIELIQSAKNELLITLPTTNAFLRGYELGIMQLLKQAATERNVKIRLLTPTNGHIEKILKDMEIAVASSNQNNTDNIDIRNIKQASEVTVNTVTIAVMDRKTSLVIEKKDDSKRVFAEAVGTAIYSTSKPIVLSYVSMIDGFWTQVEIYDQLNTQDKMQREFINIAAHELKTPAQSILGYSELLQEDQDLENREQLNQGIYRNAIRLHRLTNDILDVSRIESGTLRLSKERFSINDLISSVIEDFRNSEVKDSSIRLFYESNKDVVIEADKERITQVIYNLLLNALKFTKPKGEIRVEVSLNPTEDQIIACVKDNGQGIDSEFLPRLFTKFATISHTGIGLGLFISKNIIEAHGGKIWAANNVDAKGAAFYISIPLQN